MAAQSMRYFTCKCPTLKRSVFPKFFHRSRFISFSTAADATTNSGPDASEASEADKMMAIRNKSRMPEPLRRQMEASLAMPNIIFDYQITERYRRKLYAKFGRASGINPADICWPNEKRLKDIVEHEQEFEQTLQEMMLNVEKRKQEQAEFIKTREEQVEKNLGKLDKWLSDIQAKKEKKLAEIQAQRTKKERLIEEVRQYFGYRLSPKDPKFQEVLEKKEKEEKKAAKDAKKKEKFAKEMARIAAVAQKTVESTTGQSETTQSSQTEISASKTND